VPEKSLEKYNIFFFVSYANDGGGHPAPVGKLKKGLLGK
jgi:hypothetical protein